MIIQTLFTDPLVFIAWLCAIVIALTFHEFSHALAAYLLGDHTAKSMGRLTLNPLSHISGLGMAVLLIAGFGWGKPVPFNPYNFGNYRRDSVLVAMAGPFSNLILATLGGLALRLIVFQGLLPAENLLIQFLHILVIINVILMVFNLIPLPPLDGSKFLFALLNSSKYSHIALFLETKGPFILLFLLILDNFAGVNIFGHLFQWVIDFVYRIIF